MKNIKIAVLNFLTIILFFASAEGEEALSTINLALQQEIVEMRNIDQAVRTECVETHYDANSCKKVSELDALHQPRLKEIIQLYGWPGYRLVGEAGSEAMWLLVQHSDEDLEFQKQCLELLEKAVLNNDASPINLAYLQDRVLKHEGKNQIYGTQWTMIRGKHVLYPVEDFALLNERRLAIGLNTIEESRQMMMECYHLSEDDIFLQDPVVQETEITRFIQSNAIPIADLSALPAEISPFLADCKVILIGEPLHGTNEAPKMLLGLLKSLNQLGKPLILAIEVWTSEQNAFDRFMQTGDIEILRNSPFFTHKLQHGVSSLAMVDLLQKVRLLPNVEVLCFDPFNLQMVEASHKMASLCQSQNRDRDMAHNLLEKMNGRECAITLVLTGALHASTAVIPLLGTNYEPLGYVLSHQEQSSLAESQVFSILMKYEKGNAWCALSMDKGENITYGVHEVVPTTDAYTQAVDWQSYFLPNNPFEKGYHAVFFVRKTTASYPLNN